MQKKKLEQIFRHHGVIAYPTETVFGIGCKASDLTAVEKILTIKQRSAAKGFIILSHTIRHLQPYCARDLDEISHQLESKTPTTWLIACKPEWQGILTGNSSKVAIRLCKHPQVIELCRIANDALVSTSLNLSGQPPITTLQQARQTFQNKVDYIVEGECGKLPPSRVIDFETGKVIRE